MAGFEVSTEVDMSHVIVCGLHVVADHGLGTVKTEQAPSWDTDKPVSRQHEIAYSQYYAYPYYWAGPARWGGGWDPLTGIAPIPRPDPVEEEIIARERESADGRSRQGAPARRGPVRVASGRPVVTATVG